MSAVMKRTRSYTKVRRAEAEEATRGRIVAALVELHEEIGMSKTTVSAVAERAGVERLTVYRHFPDETAMLRACTAHWAALNPPPPFSPGAGEPAAVCRRSILRLYEWYRKNAAMFKQIHADAGRIPLISELMAPFETYLDDMTAGLDGRWPKRSSKRIATIRHALEFTTWRSLERIAGSDRRAAALAAGWLE